MFNVKQVLFKDTINIDFSKTQNLKPIKHFFWFTYHKNNFITVDEAEKILEKLKIHRSGLREHVYNFCLLSNSRLRELKNQYRDNIAYSVYYSSLQIIPEKYFEIKEYGDTILIKPNRIYLGEMGEQNTSNQLRVSLLLIPKVNNAFEANLLKFNGSRYGRTYDGIPEDINNPTFMAITPIKVTNTDSPIKLNDKFFIGLHMEVSSELIFLNESKFEMSPLFAPYHIEGI